MSNSVDNVFIVIEPQLNSNKVELYYKCQKSSIPKC